MDFRSDNIGKAAPEIIESITLANTGTATPYSNDDFTERLQKRFCELFERNVIVYTAVTGTAANAIGLSVLTPPYGVIYCHVNSHIATDECGSPELMTGGAKLVGIEGAGAKISPDSFLDALDKSGKGFVHCSQPSVLSITQATEMGMVYNVDEVSALGEIVKSNNLFLHMDGARFANAVSNLGVSPADITWRCGVDVLSFGATKNGTIAAEAIILFREELADDLSFRHKRAGQLLSKGRFISSQLLAYTENDLWLRLADKANDLALKLQKGFQALDGVIVEGKVQSNEVFVTLPSKVIEGLKNLGAEFYGWPEPWETTNTIRLVTRWDTEEREINQIIKETSTLLRELRT
tara:strand:- start:1800 stop:2852 length:1053 start_codon:yes stop_codon:yes gene_type:complete